MKRGYALIVSLSLVALMGCSKPTDTVIPSDMSTWDKELTPQLQKLPEADRLLVGKYLMRAKVGELFGTKGMPPGTTIGQALAEQKKFEAEQEAKRLEEEALKAKVEAERKATLEKMSKALTVTLLSKEQVNSNWEAGRHSDYQRFRIAVENNTEQTIIGVSGEFKFIDVFDKEVGAVNFDITETIAPHKVVTWTGGRDYNKFIDSHRAVWNLETGKYKTKFIARMVVFEDGTKLALPK